MGMDKKAQGIAFSLPVSDAAGLVKSLKEKVKKSKKSPEYRCVPVIFAILKFSYNAGV